MLESTHLRPARSEDNDFLFKLYCDARSAEVDAWGWPANQRNAFLQMQFNVRNNSYNLAFPHATSEIVCKGDVAVGWRLIAEEPYGIRLVDIALLSEFRNHGVGTSLVSELLGRSCSRGCSIFLQVLRGNPAIRLYSRLGFEVVSGQAMYLEMRWTPKSTTTKAESGMLNH